MIFNELFPEDIEEGEILKYRGRRVGLFACYLEVIGLIDACEQNNVQFEVDIALGMYSMMKHEKGTNWWEYYFEPIRAVKQDAKIHNFNRKRCLQALHACYRLSIERRKEIINKHIQPLPDVQAEIDAFSDKYDVPNRYAMHYRATDKVTEGAILFPAQYAVEKLDEMHGSNDWKLFLATDSNKFLYKMIELIGEDRVCYTESTRSSDQHPVHVSNKKGRNEILGREAVVDCYLLASCKRIFGTTSNLSTAARLISNNDDNEFVQLTVLYKEEEQEWRQSQKRKAMKKLAKLGLEDSDFLGLKWLIEDDGIIE
jgi:hypothetical protein